MYFLNEYSGLSQTAVSNFSFTIDKKILMTGPQKNIDVVAFNTLLVNS